MSGDRTSHSFSCPRTEHTWWDSALNAAETRLTTCWPTSSLCLHHGCHGSHQSSAQCGSGTCLSNPAGNSRPNHKPSHLGAPSSLGTATTQCISRCSASAVTAPPILEHCEAGYTAPGCIIYSLADCWSILPVQPQPCKCLLVPTTRWCRRVLPSGWLCSQVTFPGGHQGRNKGLGLHLPSPQRHSNPQSPTQHNSTKPAVLLVIKNNKNIFHLINLANALGSHTVLVNMGKR